MNGGCLTIIRPNRILQSLWVLSFILGVLGLSWFLIFLFQSNGPLGLIIPLMCIAVFPIFLSIFSLLKVVNFKIISNTTNLTIGKSPSFLWSEIARIEPTEIGRHGGINVFFKRNIYSELPIWKKPLGTKKAYVRYFPTKMLYLDSPSELINKIMLARRSSC